jgi:deazaflavin-dependent oxidoreductase (nitroreductase family)
VSAEQTLQQALGYELAYPNPLQRLAQRGASTRAGAWTLSRTLAPLDKAALRVTNGRYTVAALVAAVPVVTLHTTGARSGVRRSSPLIGIPLDGTLGIIGTNYGRRATPGWVYNLEANPAAEVTYRRTTAAAAARAADDEEAEHVFSRGSGLYPGYDAYRARISGRSIRVFILDHTG